MKNNGIHRLYLGIFFLLLSLGLGKAQEPIFKIHQMGEWYRDAKLNLLYEATNGLLWLGTSKGLFSYDGLSFQQFSHPDSAADNQVRAIYQDAQKCLWVGYQDGSICKMYPNASLQLWQPEEGLPKVPITGITQDAVGVIWLSTYGEGLYYWKNNRLYNIDAEEGLLGEDIYVLAKDKKDRIWVGTDGGINICSLSNGEKIVENITRADGLPDDIVYDILPDENGKMWIGMYDYGVCRYDPEKKVFDYRLEKWSNGIVNRLALFEGKELWIGTEGNGLYRLSLSDNRLRTLGEKGFWEKAKIYDLHKDIEGNIWIISNTHGLCSANRQFEFMTSETPEIQAVLMTQNEELWLGTAKGLFLGQYDDSGKMVLQEHLKEKRLNVISLYEDHYGHIWIGTFGDGLFAYDSNTGKIRRIDESDGMTNGSILSIAGTGDQLWIATLGGLTELTLRPNTLNEEALNLKNFGEQDGLSTNYIYKVFVDSKNRIWLGTDGKGLSVLENGEVHHYAYADSLPLKVVYSITEDFQGHIWLSTATQGIFEFDGTHFHRLAVKEGIRDLAITSLVTDRKGHIIIIHPTGIDLLDPVSRHLIYYDQAVGIIDIDPNLNAVSSDQEGDIWMGTKQGIVKYTALSETLSIHPRTQITQVSNFLEPLDHTLTNVFAYDKNYLTFDYIGLWYTDPETVVYRYKLEGYDLVWKKSKDRQVSYSSLPPGTYVFQLQSTENDVFAHEEPIVTYAFTINAPFWKSLWFILLVLGIIGTLFYWIVKVRERALQKSTLLKKEKIESQFETLKSQINPHFLFNSFNTLITIIEENPKIAVEYVENLSDYYRSIMQYREKEVISLKEEIELVKNYKFLLQKRFGDNLILRINTNSQPAFVAPLTLQMLVENAVKHNVISKSRPLTIEINTENEEYIVVKNNLQQKSSPEKSTQFGMQSIRARYEVLSGRKVKVEQDEAFYKVSIPIIKSEG